MFEQPPAMVDVIVANIGTWQVALPSLMLEYNPSNNIKFASGKFKQLLFDIENTVEPQTREHRLFCKTASFFYDTNDSPVYTFLRTNKSLATQSLHNFASLPKLPSLTMFQRAAEWKVIRKVAADCGVCVSEDAYDEAAAILAEWMRRSVHTTDLETTYGMLDTMNMTMLHIANNCIAIAYPELTARIMDELVTPTKNQVLPDLIDTPTSLTMLVECGTKEQLQQCPYVHRHGKTMLVMGNDPDNLQAVLAPASGTLSMYDPDMIRAKLVAEYQRSNGDADVRSLDAVRAFRVSVALYVSADNVSFILAVYHFKYPKTRTWAKYCGNLLLLYNTVLQTLDGADNARIIIAGDSNVQTVHEVNAETAPIIKQHGFVLGNTMQTMWWQSLLAFSQRSKIVSAPTSLRCRTLLGGFSQSSKCQNSELDPSDPENATGKMLASAKINMMFDPLFVNAVSMQVGVPGKATPSSDYRLDHRWVKLVVNTSIQRRPPYMARAVLFGLVVALLFFFCSNCV